MNDITSRAGPAVRQLSQRLDGPMLHRSGLVVRGHAAIDTDRLPIQSGPVAVRLSKALGLPGQSPDIIGVAVRFPPTTALVADSAGGWDMVMSGPEERVVGVHVMRPALHWNDTSLAAHGEFHYGGEVWRVFGELLTPPTGGGLSLDALERALTDAPGILTLTARSRGGPSIPVGTVDFGGAPLDADIEFDPTDVPESVRPVRGWWDDVRIAAYRGWNG